MKGDELELWIASVATLNFITVRSNRWMLIVNKHCAIFPTSINQADTWEGPEGVRLIEVSLFTVSLNTKNSLDEIETVVVSILIP